MRLRLSRPGRVLFALALVGGSAQISIAWLGGAREGGAPLVMLILLLTGVVVLDAIGRVVVATVRDR